MATLDFGTTTPTKTGNDFITEIHELLGCKPPISATVSGGKLLQVSVETEWKEGGTTPVEIVNKDGETVVDYEEDYTEKKLTKAQVDALNAYIEDNLVQ